MIKAYAVSAAIIPCRLRLCLEHDAIVPMCAE
jgi:hypothetical protein